MSRSAVCPRCDAVNAVEDELWGFRVRCTECGAIFTAGSASVTSRRAARPERDFPDEDRPRSARRGWAESPEAGPPVRKKRSTLFVLVIVFGALLCSCLLCCGGGYIAYVHEWDDPVTEADRGVLVTTDQVRARAPGLQVPPGGQFRRTHTLDGAREITFEQEIPEDAVQPFYLRCVVNLEPSPDDARTTYSATGIGLKLGFDLDGTLTQQDRNDLFRWGDQSRCVLLRKNGKPVGNWFACQKGNRVFQMILVGAVFDKPGTLRDLLTPVLQRLDQYKK